MKRNIQVKPSKASATAQFIGGIVAVMIGVLFVLPMTSEHDGPVWFAVVWIVMALIGTIAGAVNAFSDKGIPTEEIVMDDDSPSLSPRSTESRLLELEDMRKKGLVSDAEFQQTRERILKEH